MSIERMTEIMETGNEYGIRVSKGLIYDTEPFYKIGYNAAITTNEEDLWPTGAGYVFPTAAAKWRIAGGNAADRGYVIKGNAEGADQTVKCDATGSETILIDANVDFSAVTAVAVGDIVLLDPKGTSPEFGYVTDITDAATGKLVIGGGFSGGGSCATARAYSIVDKSNATGTGAQVIEVYYLNAAFEEKEVLIVLNGATAVEFLNSSGLDLTDTYRLNGMRVVAVGTGGKPAAAIVLQLSAGPNTVYGDISAGNTLDRNGFYTVPKGKILYIKSVTLSCGSTADNKVQSARLIVRGTMEEYSGFRNDGIFHPFIETILSNGSVPLSLDNPIPFTEGVDIKVSAQGLTGFSGAAACTLRGWIENA